MRSALQRSIGGGLWVAPGQGLGTPPAVPMGAQTADAPGVTGLYMLCSAPMPAPCILWTPLAGQRCFPWRACPLRNAPQQSSGRGMWLASGAVTGQTQLFQ
jgi:hypothetical protein